MHRPFVAVAGLAAAIGGCTQAYYAAMEKIGKEKRDILASRIEEGKKDQEKAKQQFATTLEAFQALTGFSGGNLEKTYKKLSNELEAAEKRAKDVRDQIKSIERVSADLFREWQAEIDGMSNARYKAQSRSLLRNTQTRYGALIGKMNDSARRMEPVLQAFRDQVLFLKHNLNSRAIASLKETGAKLDLDVGGLIKDLEASIQEADAFIATLKTVEGG